VNHLERLGNVHVIDTNMFNFARYCAAYLVKGREIALIDTGMASQAEAMLGGIKAHGFSISDISYIFVTHEHPDHNGNVATLLKESPKANVYIHPEGLQYLIAPEIERERRKERMPLAMAERFGVAEPVPSSRIKYLKDGDVFDLGDGEKLKIIFAPGHQPSGIVILDEKNKGLFINDLVGIYLPDVGCQYPLNPLRSDNIQAVDTLKKIMELPISHLLLGHYGIAHEPKKIISRAIDDMEKLLNIGRKCMRERNPEGIGRKVWEMVMPELEKLRSVRGEALYQYATQEHLPAQMELFTKYCQKVFNK